jgi:hypothetical protein
MTAERGMGCGSHPGRAGLACTAAVVCGYGTGVGGLVRPPRPVAFVVSRLR